MNRRAGARGAILLVAWLGLFASIHAQGSGPALDQVVQPIQSPPVEPVRPAIAYFRQALWSLPLAAALGAALALRPRRRGQPPRSSAVIQTQILLAVIGALVLLVVGASLARAFGVVGVAGLVRYRAKIKDPKDAGVMLATLAVGLAAGVGLWQLALFATGFVIAGLWVLELFEPELRRTFLLTVKSKKAGKLEPVITKVLRQHRAKVELRSSAPDEVSFELRLPLGQKTDDLSKSITELDPESTLAWEDKKANVPA